MIESRLKKAARGIDEAPGFDVAAADRDALVDVAYATVDSPFGRCLVAVTSKGLVRLAFWRDDEDAVLDDLSRRVSPRVLHAPARLDPVRRELDEYFDAKRRDFETPLDWSLVTGFNRKVLHATARIPYGSVSTYKDMARSAGSPRAARAAGNALHNNPIPIVVPCHRVLHSTGGLGGYGGGLDMKEALLTMEGALSA
jgi:methylated-DNA-[protein]-cysteine S-methyltransferase